MVIKKYRITAENIYNFDEKEFLIGFSRRDASRPGTPAQGPEAREQRETRVVVELLGRCRWQSL
jgi:hypothetical protein